MSYESEIKEAGIFDFTVILIIQFSSFQVVRDQWDISANIVLNPNWHELREQEKYSSIEPPRNTFYKTQ